MKNTYKLYDDTPYGVAFQAKVLSCREKDGLYLTVLDQTLFFPEEGGQSPDRGTLNSIPVKDVQIRDGVITHTLSSPLQEGSSVEGRIDWPGRYSNMQQHSGEHIVSGLVHHHFGYDNVGFHLGSQAVTLDFNGPLSAKQLTQVETEANEIIWKNLNISAVYPSPEELSSMEYRSKKELSGPIRIVTIPGCDVCACCAPHVKRTGEIGLLKIVGAQNYKGGVRLSILCGSRALADYREKQESVSSLSVLLSAKPGLVFQAAERLKEENASLKISLAQAQENMILAKAAAIRPCSTPLYLFEEKLEPVTQRNYVNLLAEKCSAPCGVFAGDDAQGYRYVIAGGESDAREVNDLLRQRFSAKGGGTALMVQGSLSGSRADILSVLSEA